MKQCFDSCETWHYHIDVQHIEQTANNGAEIKFSFVSSLYPIFEERWEITWQNFLGDFGGVVGLWLGASFLTFIDLFVYLTQLHRKKKAKQKNNEKLQGKTMHTLSYKARSCNH